MKKRIIIATTLVLAVVALAAAPIVMAGPHGRFGPAGHAFGMLNKLQHVKEELDLSDQQVDQLKAIFKETREQNAQYRTQLHDGYTGVAKALLANPNDVAGVQALVDQQTASERALKASIVNAAAKALLVLNEEQRAKLGTMLEKHAAEKHAARHGWHGR